MILGKFQEKRRLGKNPSPWVASYSARVVYTKTIIHLSVGESGGYLPPLR